MTIMGLPEWGFWLLMSGFLLYFMVLVGLVLGRTGRSPLWGIAPTIALLLPVWALPFTVLSFWILLPAMFWILAYAKWPRLQMKL